MLSNGDYLYTEVVLVDRDNSEEATATAGEIQCRFLVCMFSSVLGVYVCCVCGWAGVLILKVCGNLSTPV